MSNPFDAAIKVLENDYANHRLPYGDFGSGLPTGEPTHSQIADSIEAATRVLDMAGAVTRGWVEKHLWGGVLTLDDAIAMLRELGITVEDK